ncbi:hypothetical protein [Novosphingobium sp. RL4]|uniref:hypothetical protein n=1 Tax=Novosphingobium sp. RL4 TaxID=3109595 RepID=UPI002D7846CE|nr:hypothetical protein [Novosphingobium sp. RL4]WRT94472.1 hypothetical protein U9J33_08210 [Novosphingobium sp. RL4]
MLIPIVSSQETSQATGEATSPQRLDPVDFIRAAASVAANHITRPLMLRSAKAEKGLAKQLEREFAASVAYWELYFASGGDRVVKATDRRRPRGAGNPKLLPHSPI